MVGGYQWLRNELSTHMLPQGTVGNQLDGAGDTASPITFRTDKPPRFRRDRYPGIACAIELSPYKQWLIFCYSPLPYYARNTCFFNTVFEQALSQFTIGTIKGKSLEKYRSLVLIAALQARSELTQTPSVIKSAHLAKLLHITPQHWRAAWAPRWSILIESFKAHDCKALNDVALSIANCERAS